MRKVAVLLFSSLLLVVSLFAQDKTIKGRVVDKFGNPLVGVTVAVQGTPTLAATTDANGNYSLTMPARAKALVFTYVGFGEQVISIGNNSAIDAMLEERDADLEEVVVTGYGKQQRTSFTGAASKVEAKAIETVPIGSFDQILQGRSPGLRVSAGSGQPGSAASVQIRGPKSISGGSTPLYIIDGVQVEASVFQSLNPNDFESVDVIRDASAAALYGSRGAAGVIVVTTKRGKAGRTQMSYRGQYGISQAGTQQFEMLDTDGLLLFQENLGKQIPGINLPGWVNSPANPVWPTLSAAEQARRTRVLDSIRGINTDWRDIFQRQGQFTAHDINLQGGTDRTRFFSSFGYYDEEGIGLRSDLTRYTFRFNLDHTTDKLTFQTYNTIGYSKRNFIESENGVALANPFAAAYLGLPYHRLYNDDGTLSTGGGRTGPNAMDRIENTMRYNNQVKATTSLRVNYDFTDHLYGGIQAGADFRETNNTFWLNPNSFTARTNSGFPTNTGAYSDAFDRYVLLSGRAYMGYKWALKDVHNFDVTLNSETIHEFSKSFNFTGYGLNAKLPNTPAAITPGTVDNRLIPPVGGGRTESTIVSFFGQLKYNYDSKYFFEFTARRDGTSRLPVDNRWQNFYAGGVVWNVLRENFAAGWNGINTLRVRASYGSSANSQNFPLGNFGYLALYGAGSYAGLPSLVPSTPGNPGADWEYADKANIGIDFGFFNNRLNGSLNLYNEVTRNLYITQTLPAEAGGFTSNQVNAGKMGNKGVEIELNYDIIRNRDLTWSVGGNFTYNKNEILDLGQVSEFPQGTAIIREGLPLGAHYVVKWAGVDAATGAPLYEDLDGKLTTQFNSATMSQATFGTFYAPYIGGFNTNLSWKGFEFSAFFNFQYKFSRFNNQDFFQLNHAFALQGFNLRSEMLTMWQKPGDVTDIQSPLYQRQFSSKDIQDASYLRFRNINVAYNLPRSIFQRQKVVNGVRIYGQAQNLYTWTNWTGFDPEDNNNIAQYEYPLPRLFTFGIDVTF